MFNRIGLLLAMFACAAGCTREPSARVDWTCMGTVAAVQTRAMSPAETADVAQSVKTVFARLEHLLSAHDATSELRRLSALPETEIVNACHPSVRACYAAAFQLMRASGGAFNPRWRGPRTLDLGAIAKGFAVDCAASVLTNVTGDVLIDLGGNLKSVRGTWRVGIATSDERLVLTPGMACATSAEYFRGKHIADGRTGLPVSNNVVSVTVVHPSSALLADGLSTTLFVLGQKEGEKFLREHHPDARSFWQVAQHVSTQQSSTHQSSSEH